MKKCFSALFLAIAALASVQVKVESQDILILPLAFEAEQVQVKQTPLHITFRQGYDNQPKFSADGNSIFFTRMLSEPDSEQQQTDIFQYQFESGHLINITNTPDHSEFSPTPAGDNTISVIGVNPQGKQHLRKIKVSSGDQETLRADIEPVGYHAWLTEHKAAVFVLGEPMTLQILDAQTTSKPEVLANNIGRCFEIMADQTVSFSIEKEGKHQLHSVDALGQVLPLNISLPEGVQDYVWLDDSSVIVGDGSKLFRVDSEGSTQIADLANLGVSGITRLTLSPDKSKLAIVYNRP